MTIRRCASPTASAWRSGGEGPELLELHIAGSLAHGVTYWRNFRLGSIRQ